MARTDKRKFTPEEMQAQLDSLKKDESVKPEAEGEAWRQSTQFWKKKKKDGGTKQEPGK